MEQSECKMYLKVLCDIDSTNVAKNATIKHLAIDHIEILFVDLDITREYLMSKYQNNFSDWTDKINKKMCNRIQEEMSNITISSGHTSSLQIVTDNEWYMIWKGSKGYEVC